MLGCLEWLWFLIGLWTVVKVSFSLINSLKSLRGNTDYTQYGLKSWALITGSTDGIGFGFAEHLAAQGFNIILVARNLEKLNSVSKSLEERFPIKTKCIIKDFSLATNNPSEFFQDIKTQTQGLDISILVNNVGGGGLGPNFFHLYLEKKILNANTLNLWPIVFLTKLYLPDLIDRKQRSAIINLASIRSTFIEKNLSVYPAGKSFDDLFTLIIADEVKYLCRGKESNTDILSLRPGYVDTPLIKNAKSPPLLITPQKCVSSAFRAVGTVNYTYGHLKHMALAALICINPMFMKVLQKLNSYKFN